MQAVEQAGVAILHVDVMDGHFVPSLTVGPPVIRSLRKATRLTLDAHLMIENADNFIDEFAAAGADMISVHAEACPHLHRTVTAIKSKGLKAGVVLNPATPLSVLDDILPEANYVLLMSVNPGWGGQKFIPHVKDKIRALRGMIRARGCSTLIEVDGGVTEENIAELAAAGADILVAGNAVFGGGDPRQAAARLIALLGEPRT